MKKVFILFAIFCLAGCSPKVSKTPTPEASFMKIGHAQKTLVDDEGNVITSYVFLGLNDKDQITYMYADETSQNPQLEKQAAFTKKELGNNYGLGYTSDKGEWGVQIRAFENYVSSHKLDKIAVEKLEVDEKDGKKIPKSGSDLATACELDISVYQELIVSAIDNAIAMEAMRIGVGEYITVSEADDKVEQTLVMFSVDYLNRINYIYIDKFNTNINKETVSLRDGNDDISKGLKAFEEYAVGRYSNDISNNAFYDKGDGVNNVVAIPSSDLGKVCTINLKEVMMAFQDANNRLAK